MKPENIPNSFCANVMFHSGASHLIPYSSHALALRLLSSFLSSFIFTARTMLWRVRLW